MARYKVVLSGKAQKQLDKLSDRIAEPILERCNICECWSFRSLRKRLKTRIRILRIS